MRKRLQADLKRIKKDQAKELTQLRDELNNAKRLVSRDASNQQKIGQRTHSLRDTIQHLSVTIPNISSTTEEIVAEKERLSCEVHRITEADWLPLQEKHREFKDRYTRAKSQFLAQESALNCDLKLAQQKTSLLNEEMQVLQNDVDMMKQNVEMTEAALAKGKARKSLLLQQIAQLKA